MSGEVAQSLAIATHLTMWLAESRGGSPGSDDLSGLPTFADMVAFDSVVGFEAWGERLAGDGVDRLWLAVADTGFEPELAGFVGGVPVGLLSTGPAGSRWWQPRWSNGTRATDGAQIVVANYLSEPVPAEPARIAVDTAAQQLDQVLRQAAGFADRQRLPTWSKTFTEARQPPARDVFPPSWPDVDSRRLADTALAAWVFGGMGSWNDLGFDDDAVQQEYRQLSRDLLDAVLRACVAAVNVELP